VQTGLGAAVASSPAAVSVTAGFILASLAALCDASSAMGSASSPVLTAASAVWLRLAAVVGATEDGSADVAACSCASDGLTMRCQTLNIDFSWLKGSGTWTTIALAMMTFWLNTLRDTCISKQEVNGHLPSLKVNRKQDGSSDARTNWHARLHTAKQLCDIQHASQLADSRSQHSKQDKARAQTVLIKTVFQLGDAM